MCIRKGKLAARGEEIEREGINSCGVLILCYVIMCTIFPRIVAAGNKRGTRPCVQMISDDGSHASASTVCVVRVVPTADSRAERLRILLAASSNHHRLTHMYLIQPSLMSPSFPKK